jgi:hypothetical protein
MAGEQVDGSRAVGGFASAHVDEPSDRHAWAKLRRPGAHTPKQPSLSSTLHSIFDFISFADTLLVVTLNTLKLP